MYLISFGPAIPLPENSKDKMNYICKDLYNKVLYNKVLTCSTYNSQKPKTEKPKNKGNIPNVQC